MRCNCHQECCVESFNTDPRRRVNCCAPRRRRDPSAPGGGGAVCCQCCVASIASTACELAVASGHLSECAIGAAAGNIECAVADDPSGASCADSTTFRDSTGLGCSGWVSDYSCDETGLYYEYPTDEIVEVKENCPVTWSVKKNGTGGAASNIFEFVCHNYPPRHTAASCEPLKADSICWQ